MKKLMQCLSVVMLLSVVTPVQLKAEKALLSTSVNSEKMARNANEKASFARLKAIREMSRSNLSKSEKQALREEVKAIRSRHTGPGGVVYISTGALVLIIILLIILL